VASILYLVIAIVSFFVGCVSFSRPLNDAIGLHSISRFPWLQSWPRSIRYLCGLMSVCMRCWPRLMIRLPLAALVRRRWCDSLFSLSWSLECVSCFVVVVVVLLLLTVICLFVLFLFWFLCFSLLRESLSRLLYFNRCVRHWLNFLIEDSIFLLFIAFCCSWFRFITIDIDLTHVFHFWFARGWIWRTRFG
jgi:hypothetical protein